MTEIVFTTTEYDHTAYIREQEDFDVRYLHSTGDTLWAIIKDITSGEHIDSGGYYYPGSIFLYSYHLVSHTIGDTQTTSNPCVISNTPYTPDAVYMSWLVDRYMIQPTLAAGYPLPNPNFSTLNLFGFGTEATVVKLANTFSIPSINNWILVDITVAVLTLSYGEGFAQRNPTTYIVLGAVNLISGNIQILSWGEIMASRYPVSTSDGSNIYCTVISPESSAGIENWEIQHLNIDVGATNNTALAVISTTTLDTDYLSLLPIPEQVFCNPNTQAAVEYVDDLGNFWINLGTPTWLGDDHLVSFDATDQYRSGYSIELRASGAMLESDYGTIVSYTYTDLLTERGSIQAETGIANYSDSYTRSSFIPRIGMYTNRYMITFSYTDLDITFLDSVSNVVGESNSIAQTHIPVSTYVLSKAYTYVPGIFTLPPVFATALQPLINITQDTILVADIHYAQGEAEDINIYSSSFIFANHYASPIISNITVDGLGLGLISLPNIHLISTGGI